MSAVSSSEAASSGSPSIPEFRFRKRSNLTLPIAQFAQVVQQEMKVNDVEEEFSVQDPNSCAGFSELDSCSLEQAEGFTTVTASQTQTTVEMNNRKCLSFDGFVDEEEYRMYLAEINKTHQMRDSERSVRLLCSVRRLERSAHRNQVRREKENHNGNGRLFCAHHASTRAARFIFTGLQTRTPVSIRKPKVREVCEVRSGDVTNESDEEDFCVNATTTSSCTSTEDDLCDSAHEESHSPLPHMGNALHELFRTQHEQQEVAEKKREADEKQDLFSPVHSKLRPTSSHFANAFPSAYVDGRPEIHGSKLHNATFVSNQRSSVAAAAVTIQQYRAVKTPDTFMQLRRTSHAPARPTSAANEKKNTERLVFRNKSRRLVSDSPVKISSAQPVVKIPMSSTSTPFDNAHSVAVSSKSNDAIVSSLIRPFTTTVHHSILPQLLSEQKQRNQSTRDYLQRMQRQRLEIDQVAQESYNLALQLMRSSRSTVANAHKDMIGCVSTGAFSQSSDSSSSFVPYQVHKMSSKPNSVAWNFNRSSHQPSLSAGRHRVVSSPPGSPTQSVIFASKQTEAVYQTSQRFQVIPPIRIDSESNVAFMVNSPNVAGLHLNRSSATSNTASTTTHPSMFSSHHFTLKPSTPLLVATV